MRELTIPACRVNKVPWKYGWWKFTIEVPPGARERVQKLLEFCFTKHGGFCGLKLIPPRTRRTTGKKSQNTHLNGHIQSMTTETGESFDVIKAKIKAMAVDMGYPILEDENGAPQYHALLGWIKGISESDASIEDCAILIDAAHRLAAELGVDLIEEGNLD